MSRPTEVTLKKGEQNRILKARKRIKDARRIAEEYNLARHQVMFFLEEQGLNSYSDRSYS